MFTFGTQGVVRLAYAVCIIVCCGCNSAKPIPALPAVQPSSELADAPPVTLSVLHPDDWFEDVTAQSGISASYQTGRSSGLNTILETVGGGVGLVDFDLDAQLDLYAVGGGTIDAATGTPRGVPGRLFRQHENERFHDVTKSACLSVDTDYSHGILAADYDSDGFPDLFLTCYGDCQMWRNLGDGTFQTVTQSAGLIFPGWHTAAASADLNGDGHLDLYIADYVNWSPQADAKRKIAVPSDIPPPQQYEPLPDHLYLNLGDGRFEDVSMQAGIRSDGMGLGVLAADFNDDGAADVYVANDVVGNHLYWGGSEFPLQEAGESVGVSYNESGTPEGSMGVDAADVNGDGFPDLWVTNFELEDNSLYLHVEGGLFQHATVRMGLAGQGRALVGFGTGFHDFDSDGWPDLYVLNGHVQYQSQFSPFRQPAMVLRNVNGQRFENVTSNAGPWFSRPHTARGGAAGDWNRDGSVDLVISHLDEPVTMLRNRLPAAPGLRLRLVGVTSPRDPIGATVRVQSHGRPIVRYVKSGSGYLSQSDSRILIPWESSAEVAEVFVQWPSKRREYFRVAASPADQVLVEGRGTVMDRIP